MFHCPDTTRATEKTLLPDTLMQAMATITDTPPVFPGGDIGSLAVNTAASRLLAAGATPRYLTASLILGPDTDESILQTIVDGMERAAVQNEAEWSLAQQITSPSAAPHSVTLTVTATGYKNVTDTSALYCPSTGDTLILTAPAGNLGAALYGQKRGFDTKSAEYTSGIALTDVMRAVIEHTPAATLSFYPSQGITAALDSLGINAHIDTGAIPATDLTAKMCRHLGLDIRNLTTAGALLIAVRPDKARALIDALHRFPASARAAIIGEVC